MSAQNTNTVLAVFPALTVPVTKKQATTFSSNIAQVANWNSRQILGLSVISLTYLLAHAGGVDYRSNHSLLRNDAEAFMGAFEIVGTNSRNPNGILDVMEAVTDWNVAYGADTTITTNTNTLATALKGMQDTPESTLRFFIVFLRYACSIKGV